MGGPEHPIERAVQNPAAERGVKRGPRPVQVGNIPPGSPGTELPHDPVEASAVVQPLPPPHRHGQQLLDELPLGNRKFTAVYHDSMIHHQRSFEDTAYGAPTSTPWPP